MQAFAEICPTRLGAAHEKAIAVKCAGYLPLQRQGRQLPESAVYPKLGGTADMYTVRPNIIGRTVFLWRFV